MRPSLLTAAVAAALSLAPSASFAQRAEDAFGTWRHPDNGSYVKMYACGKRLCARIVKITDEQKSDDKNPDASLRERPVVGMLILTAKKVAPNKWSGRLYNRADGKTYTGTITVSSRSTLSLDGCTMAIFCKSAVWTRVGG
jgi:uncharacterized protein (DUF2147 family)